MFVSKGLYRNVLTPRKEGEREITVLKCRLKAIGYFDSRATRLIFSEKISKKIIRREDFAYTTIFFLFFFFTNLNDIVFEEERMFCIAGLLKI